MNLTISDIKNQFLDMKTVFSNMNYSLALTFPVKQGHTSKYRIFKNQSIAPFSQVSDRINWYMLEAYLFLQQENLFSNISRSYKLISNTKTHLR